MSAEVQARAAPADDQATHAPEGEGRALRSAQLGPVLVSVLGALVFAGAVMAVTGQDPFAAYRAMFVGAVDGAGLANTVGRAVPIVGIAVALCIAFRAGVFNLGVEGQLVLGGLAGTVTALSLPGPGPLVAVAALLAAAVTGGVWALLASLLQTRVGVPILITSLLLNYPARYLASYLVRFPLDDPELERVATRQVPEAAQLVPFMPRGSAPADALADALGRQNPITLLLTSVNVSVILVVALVVAVAVAGSRTVAGYETGMAGLNPRFARYGGVPMRRLTHRVMFVSGAIGGVIGAMLVLGEQSRYSDGELVATNYAWTGLMVALLAGTRPVGSLIAGTFFAAIAVGSLAMQREAGVTAQLASVIQAVVIVFLAVRVGLPWLRRRGRDRTATSQPVPRPAAAPPSSGPSPGPSEGATGTAAGPADPAADVPGPPRGGEEGGR